MEIGTSQYMTEKQRIITLGLIKEGGGRIIHLYTLEEL